MLRSAKMVLLPCLLVMLAAPMLRLAAQSSKQARDNNPDVVEVRHYRLTMEKIDKLVAATEALNKMIAADPGLKKKMDTHDEDDATIDQKVKNIDTNFPQAAAALHGSGLTTREYIVISLAFLNDLTLVAMKKDGMIKELPADTVTAENQAFIELNYEKLKAIGASLTPPDSGSQ